MKLPFLSSKLDFCDSKGAFQEFQRKTVEEDLPKTSSANQNEPMFKSNMEKSERKDDNNNA